MTYITFENNSILQWVICTVTYLCIKRNCWLLLMPPTLLFFMSSNCLPFTILLHSSLSSSLPLLTLCSAVYHFSGSLYSQLTIHCQSCILHYILFPPFFFSSSSPPPPSSLDMFCSIISWVLYDSLYTLSHLDFSLG